MKEKLLVDGKTNLLRDMKQALQIFLDCPGWRRFVHEETCTDPDGHHDYPEDRICTCDGPANVEFIETVAKEAGLVLTNY